MKPNRIFQTFTALILAMAAGFAFPVQSVAQDEPDSGALGLARVSYITGDVLFTPGDDGEWAEVSPNYPLIPGDRLWVGDDSRLEIRFGTGETAWVNYQSELDMLALSRGDDGNAYQMGLPFGEASFDVKNFEILGSVLQVDTPNASVRAFGRALFRVSSLSDGTTQIGVVHGSVEVETDRGIANVHDGEMLEVYPSGRSRITDLPGMDDWDDWVEARLDRYDRPYRSTRYLPGEMSDYADEFDNGGRWVSEPSYGNVWVPTVASGWSPYSNGRWIYSGWDYVWLPYDPWYAPFHYGRWHWTVSFGWCWVPPVRTAVYWSPGYVGWVWDTDYVYWVPLAPAEVYYGYGHFGPHSVNIYHTTVIVNKTVYRNSDVRNGVVVVGRDNFLRGKTVRIKEDRVVRKFKEKIVRKEVHKEKIVREEATFGAPPVKVIKPIRETRLPKPDKVVKADRLPKKVVERKSFERERKVVKGKVKSAFQPAVEPKHMKDLERIQKPEFKRDDRDKSRERKIERKPSSGGDSRTIERSGKEDVRGREAEPERSRDRDTGREIDRSRDKDSSKDRSFEPSGKDRRSGDGGGAVTQERSSRDSSSGKDDSGSSKSGDKRSKSKERSKDGKSKDKDRDKDGRDRSGDGMGEQD